MTPRSSVKSRIPVPATPSRGLRPPLTTTQTPVPCQVRQLPRQGSSAGWPRPNGGGLTRAPAVGQGPNFTDALVIALIRLIGTKQSRYGADRDDLHCPKCCPHALARPVVELVVSHGPPESPSVAYSVDIPMSVLIVGWE